MTKLKKDTYRKELGQRIAFVRKSLRDQDGKPYSQEKFSDEFGISPKTVGRHERGDNFPRLDTLQQLRKEYGVNLNYVLCGKGPVILEIEDCTKAESWNLHQRLREVRLNAGLTQLEMSRLIGHSSNTWKKYEEAKRTPSYDILCFLHTNFYVDLNWLIFGV